MKERVVIIIMLFVSVSQLAWTRDIQMKRVKVLDSKMFYREGGQGDPIVFLHGIPSSSFMWRALLPVVSEYARVIAPDLIGQGKSGKPFIEHRFKDQIEYFGAFVDALEIESMTLVVTDTGSPIGLSYAAQNPERVRAIAFYEALLGPPPSPDALTGPAATIVNPETGWRAVMDEDIFFTTILPDIMTVNGLDNRIINKYRRPYQNPKNRRPLLAMPRDIPLPIGIDPESGDQVWRPADSFQLFTQYANHLIHADIPKLFLYGYPGLLNPPETVEIIRDAGYRNVTTACVGESAHLLPEEQPAAFTYALIAWFNWVVVGGETDEGGEKKVAPLGVTDPECFPP